MYQIDNEQGRDLEYHHDLMEGGIKSSKEAKAIKTRLEDIGALPHLKNNYDWAMLCIGYCFAKNIALNKAELIQAPDTNGMEIPSLKTAFQGYARFWLAFLSDALFELNVDKGAVTADDLYRYIRTLWHTGAVKLQEEWENCKRFKPDSHLKAKQAFLRELTELALKNAKAVGTASSGKGGQVSMPTAEETENQCRRLQDALKQASLPVIIKLEFQHHGVRYDRFVLQLAGYADLDKKHEVICSALGMGNNSLRISRCKGIAHGFYVDVLRDENQWQYFGKEALQKAITEGAAHTQGYAVPVIVGLDEMGKTCYRDLADCNHMLVAGASGSGKSVFVRALLGSLLGMNDAENVKVALFGPKVGGDYTAYETAPHIWQQRFVTETEDIKEALHELVAEMEERNRLLKQHKVAKLAEIPTEHRPPYLFVVIDEVADILDSDDEVETPIKRLSQLGRASGIFVILATQSPDSKTLTTALLVNLSTRIAFRTKDHHGSRTIMSEAGAETLQGKGDHFVKWFGGEKEFMHGFDC